MADVSQITLPNGSTYDIKDKTIRDEVQFKVYDSVADLGLTVSSATLAGAWAALPYKSMLICEGYEFSASEFSGATQYGVVEMVKSATDTRGWINMYGRTPDDIGIGDWRMGINANGVPMGTWYRVADGSTWAAAVPNGNAILSQNCSLTVKRNGNIVTLSGHFETTYAITGYDWVAAIPVGYRPSNAEYLPNHITVCPMYSGSYGASALYLDRDKLYTWSTIPGASQWWVSGTWIIS